MIRRLFLMIAVFGLLFFVSSPSYSQGFLSLENVETEVRLVVGEVHVFKIDSPQRVSIRNPEIADISKVTDSEVVVVAKQQGETTLTIWDKNGQKLFFVIVHPQDAVRVKQKMETLINQNLNIDNVHYKINETSGKVMIFGEVTPRQFEQVEKVLSGFYDESGRSLLLDNLLTITEENKMVEIDCQVLEMNKTDLDRLGFKWVEYLQIREEPYSAASSSDDGVQTTLNRVSPWSKLWPIHEASRDALHTRINFLVRNNRAKVLSRPKLLCLSGKEAKLVVGGEVPYISASTTGSAGTSVSVEYREYGVILKLRPEVLANDKILLNVGTEVSELDWANAIVVSSIQVPAFLTRKAETSLNVVSGDTIIIGGLIKNDESKNVDKLPWMGDVPIIGALFRSKEFQNDQTELVITLTPLIKKSELETAMQEAAEASGKVTVGKPIIYPDYLQKDTILNDYILRIQRMIFQSLNYPRLAQEAGWQGAMTLKLRISHTGEVVDSRISESSGYISFDNSVLTAAKALSPYPPFPMGIDLEDLWVDIPIVYKMDY
ncbi:MAG: TonB family protein [Candidatus Omnitrophica bacterium]|nr:TonB family protein [Candidatus Omnitrophota bacterium]MBU2250704.1 TonB family protein [Candidatus Omnitrophota bacterium]